MKLYKPEIGFNYKKLTANYEFPTFSVIEIVGAYPELEELNFTVWFTTAQLLVSFEVKLS